MKKERSHSHDHSGHEHGAHGNTSGHESHDKHSGHSPAMFRDKFWLSFALTLPVVYWSDHIEGLLGYTAVTFPGSIWIPPLLATLVFL